MARSPSPKALNKCVSGKAVLQPITSFQGKALPEQQISFQYYLLHRGVSPSDTEKAAGTGSEPR